ncbi:MAG: hypothetical protein IJW17_00230 [Lentisphaeria bacterium]|nr:hypothetical protein [Lentisphaeria bacterium]MBQ9774443.1 hypothetical protein [Lentisphaeria bacterium]
MRTVSPAEMEELPELDRAGFFPAPGETAEEFRKRVRKIRRVFSDFDKELRNGTAEFDGLKLSAAGSVPDEFVRDAGEVTEALYGFQIRHVPGFFLSRGVGLLWGGCMIGDTESGFSLFLIRSTFRKRSRYLVYDRRELFAHELCHAARMCLGENSRFEEHFAYQTSGSRLRRTFGNCFVRTYDALAFVGGSFLLLLGQILRVFLLPSLPIWPFWILALAYPFYLLLRNHAARRILKKAEHALLRHGFSEPQKVLFRATDREIEQLAAGVPPEQFRDLRWELIRSRFGQK